MSKTYLGLDLGTSSLKILLTDESGNILDEVNEPIESSHPHVGWSEQNPSDWFTATLHGLNKVFQNHDPEDLRAVSFGGHMHGSVLLDDEDRVIRPCIMWNDGRTKKETDYLNNEIGKERLTKLTGNIAFAGFTAPKILWIRENEPENFAKISKILLPKDYLAFMFSGVYSTDVSDASGTLFFDTENRRWSKEMCEICSIREDQLPQVFESYEVVGTIKPSIAELFGFRKDVKIVAGAGDNEAAAIGTGTVREGRCNISLGTSGTLFIPENNYIEEKTNSLHSFCHANGKYHLMGVILSAASANTWWSNIIKDDDFDEMQEGLEEKLGKNDVYFLPYLMGERSPHNDTDARACFIGMNSDTTQKEMTLAVLEGVSFAMRDCAERAKLYGTQIREATLCGGGAKSKLWRQITADVFNAKIMIPQTEKGPSYGACILAMVGDGIYKNVEEATDKIIKIKEVVYPDEERVALYNEKYRKYASLYPALKEFFKE